MDDRTIICEGHLVDNGLLSEILNLIITEGFDYKIENFEFGKFKTDTSHVEIALIGQDNMDLLLSKLTPLGVYEKGASEGEFITTDKDKHAPEGFYSSTNHRSEVFIGGKWRPVSHQRMDAAIVKSPAGELICTKLRDLKKGDMVLCGSDSVRVYPPRVEGKGENFSFMSNDVSSERSYAVAAARIAQDLKDIKEKGGKLVVVCGPVVVHTGGKEALAALIREGYIHGFLGGNAVAVHDLEDFFYGTSLGVDMKSGFPTHGGHNHHMRAINRIHGYGSIKKAIEAGDLTDGLMYRVIKSGIPYCLAGSIRDDGPLPETVNDMIEAQKQYAEIIKDSDMILMLSSMLHSIGTGNMTPSWVKTVCVDINPAVVTKLSDRGSAQAIGIVSDVGFFLRELAVQLKISY
jgi:lysine-ketoglutarate reductase/saccharopine dehydrogenase-like protein (TIGR00300 family)